ncbi:MAG: acetyl-CoA carboxylase biotin carboxyl carrier protein subunit [Burkholderiaceae bacterium]|jgi:biotin carboxyl carrier protein|nr:acetyl-CoA carboxylase biotin carboxyl carrier protein subunit [Burkholderiaceae bacterium]MEB2318891.1 acetyl-CoA carboxylase biotin carboxyl carrier protein subunit [Pseudomonadota bacterium]
MSRDVHSEVSGSIFELLVAPGDEVAEGDTLLLVESMKMEIPIEAPVAGVVAAVHVIVGDAVAEDQRVVSIDPR